MDSPDRHESPRWDRNPSPPPEIAENEELLKAESIGNTAFSKHWLFTTLIKLIEVSVTWKCNCHSSKVATAYYQMCNVWLKEQMLAFQQYLTL